MALRMALRAMLAETSACRGQLLELAGVEVCSTSGRADLSTMDSRRWYSKQKKPQRALNNKANWVGVNKFIKRIDTQSPQDKVEGETIATALPPIDALDEVSSFAKVGSITGSYQLSPLAAFAVVEIGGKQFKVTRDDVVYSEKLTGVDINDVIALQRVLMAADQHGTVIGRPYIPNAQVLAAVESHFKDAKITVYKKKPGTNYARNQGHRQQLTALRILDIEGVPELKTEPSGVPMTRISGSS